MIFKKKNAKATEGADVPVMETEAAEGTSVVAQHTELPAEFLAKRRRAKRKKITKPVVIPTFIAPAAAGAYFYFNAGEEPEMQTIEGTGTYTQAVTRGTIENTIEGSGTLTANATVTDSAQVSGTVSKVYVAVGDTVEEGDTLFTLTSSDVSDAISEASSNVSSAQKTYNSALKTYNAAKKAYAKAKKQAKKSNSSSSSSENSNEMGATSSTSSSTSAVSEAKSTYEQAKEALAQAKEALTQAKSNYSDAASQTSYLTVTASTSGTVSSVGVAAGDEVGSSSASMSAGTGSSSGVTIIDMSKMTVSMSVSEYYIGQVEVGQKATVTVTALGEEVNAKVTEVAMSASSDGGSTAYYSVTLTINKPTSSMLEGMSVTTKLIYESWEDALLVPTAAITENADGTAYVTVVASDESTSQVAVTVLGGNDEETAVEADLSEGDLIQVGYTMTSSSSDDSTDSGFTFDMGGMGDAASMGGGMGGDASSMPSGGGQMGGGSAPGGN